MQKEQQNSRSSASKKTAPKSIKPPEQERLKKSLKLADGGKEGAASGDYRVNPKTDKLETREEKKPNLPVVIPEYSKEADIISSLPTDFDFKGWDNKPARQQQKELQKAGLNPEEQMVLLNSKTSLDTLATIVDINRNRNEYGLSDSNVKQIAEELLQIADARIGASSHDLPLGTSPVATKTFLTMMEEKEQSLLSSFGYGVNGLNDLNNPYSDIGDQISDVLEGDDSITALLHTDSDVFQVADQFFDGMTKIDTLISDIESGKVRFKTPADKQRYLDYLTSEYDKNNELYRRQLANKIDEAKLLQYPETQFKQLINDLSMSQLELLTAQVDANGVKKLSRPHNFEKLMKELLSDKDSALNLYADETKSPVRPRVWNGMEIVDGNKIHISGYYYEKGRCYTKLTCGDEYMNVDLGTRYPSDVSVEASSTTDWEMLGEQIGLAFKILATPAMIADGAYALATQNGVPAFLPENLSPSDVPYLGEALDAIDPWDHTAHLTKETISMHLVTHYQNNSITDDNLVRFKTYKG